MLKVKLILVALFLVISSNAAASDWELQRMRDKIENLEKDLNMLQKEYYKSSRKNKRAGSFFKPSPKIGVQIESLEEQVRNMNGKIEEAEHKIANFAIKLDKIIEDIDFRISKIEQQNTPIANISQDNQNNVDNITNDVFDDEEIIGIGLVENNQGVNNYDAAFTLMREARYDEAEKELLKFIKENKSDENSKVGDAYYWLGETFYVRGNFEQAAVNFLKSYQKFPTSGKVSDSLYKLALSLGQLNRAKEACTTLSKYVKEFPDLSKTNKQDIESKRTSFNCS